LGTRHRGKYGCRRHKVTGKWIKLYNKDVYNLFKSRRMRSSAQEAYNGEMRNEYEMLIGKPAPWET
jgi:hypothetical protein